MIDGRTDSIALVQDPNAGEPYAVSVNPATNKIYVANAGGQTNNGNVTVIDGATNKTTTVTDPKVLARYDIDVNSHTNKIYVANYGIQTRTSSSVTVIDGKTNGTTNVKDPNAQYPSAVAVDPTYGQSLRAELGRQRDGN